MTTGHNLLVPTHCTEQLPSKLNCFCLWIYSLKQPSWKELVSGRHLDSLWKDGELKHGTQPYLNDWHISLMHLEGQLNGRDNFECIWRPILFYVNRDGVLFYPTMTQISLWRGHLHIPPSPFTLSKPKWKEASTYQSGFCNDFLYYKGNICQFFVLHWFLCHHVFLALFKIW